MKPENILKSIKAVLKKNIERLSKSVKSEEENTYINGSLGQAQAILETIENYEQMPDWYTGDLKE